MFRIQFYCPRQAPFWQDYKEGIFFKTVKYFPNLASAIPVCDSLIWQYHSARVLDVSGRIAYQI